MRLLAPGLISTAIAALACGKGHGGDRDDPGVAQAAEPAPIGVPVARVDPWQLSPAGAVVGIVAQPGALARFGTGWMAAEQRMAARPETAGWGDELAALRRRLPLAAVDPDGLRAAGIDPDGGAGLFLDERAALLLVVLPVREPERFAAAAGGKRAGADWRVAGMTCGVRDVGFVCGADADAIEVALSGGDHTLRARVASLPAAERGEVELVGDLAAMPDMAGVRTRLGAVVRDAGLVVASLRAGATVELRVWVQGAPAAPWGTLFGDPSPVAQLDAIERGAPAGLRVRLALPQLIAFVLPPTAVPDRPDLAGVLIDLFTGDLLVAGRGRGPLAGEVALGLADADGVRAALPELCRAPLGALGRVDRAEPGRCSITIDLPPERASHPLASAALEVIHGRTLEIAVDRDLLRVTTGSGGAGPTSRPLTALGREPWQLYAWAEQPDPFLAMSPELRARVDARLAELTTPARARLDAIRWLAAQVAGAALGVRFDRTGFHLRLAAHVIHER